MKIGTSDHFQPSITILRSSHPAPPCSISRSIQSRSQSAAMASTARGSVIPSHMPSASFPSFKRRRNGRIFSRSVDSVIGYSLVGLAIGATWYQRSHEE